MNAPFREDPKVREWIETARTANVLDVARGWLIDAKLKNGGAEWIGHCPAGCTKNGDGFSVAPGKNIFLCRPSGESGDAIALVSHVKACGFFEAVELLTGEPRPSSIAPESDEQRAARERRQRERDAAKARQDAADARAAEAKRRRDEDHFADVLARSVAIEGTHAAAYLKARGLTPAAKLTRDLRFVRDLDYWGFADAETKIKTEIAVLPAMVAIVRDAAGAMIGLHQTFLDPREPRKWSPTGDATRNKAKKIRGEARGGMIRLGRVGERLCIGEGIEKTLGWHALGYGPEDVTLATSISLGNLVGSCTGSIDHPTLTDEKTGKPLKIRNGVPDMERPGVILPAGVREVIVIVDSTSEPVSTRMGCLAFGRRCKAQGVAAAFHMSPAGADFDEVALAQMRELAA